MVRLLTWNIRGGLGVDGRRSIQRIVEVIRASRAEIVCLQEVHARLPESLFQDQPAALRRMVGMEVLFQPNLRVGPGRFGNVLATSLPLLSHDFVSLPNPAERRRPALRFEGRGMIEARVSTDAGLITVLCGHWGLAAADRTLAAGIVGERARAAGGPVVVAGDLNAAADSPEVRNLLTIGGLLDCVGDIEEPTYPSDLPAARIDYVLRTTELSAVRLDVLQSLASDHLPLLAELDLSRERTTG